MASGIGITPMRALLEDLEQQPGDVVLVYRARSQDDVILREELVALAEARGRACSSPPAHAWRTGTAGCPPTPPT